MNGPHSSGPVVEWLSSVNCFIVELNREWLVLISPPPSGWVGFMCWRFLFSLKTMTCREESEDEDLLKEVDLFCIQVDHTEGQALITIISGLPHFTQDDDNFWEAKLSFFYCESHLPHPAATQGKFCCLLNRRSSCSSPSSQLTSQRSLIPGNLLRRSPFLPDFTFPNFLDKFIHRFFMQIHLQAEIYSPCMQTLRGHWFRLLRCAYRCSPLHSEVVVSVAALVGCSCKWP